MKKIIILALLMGALCSAFAFKVETTSGITHKGSFVRRTGDLFFLKTNLGEVGIFAAEITRVYSDTGEEVTDHFLALPSESATTKAYAAPKEPQSPISPHLTYTQPDYTTQLWIIAAATVIYYTYSMIRIENPKKQKIPEIPTL